MNDDVAVVALAKGASMQAFCGDGPLASCRGV